MWFCARAIFYYRLNGQGSFLIHENVYLIEADGDSQALVSAEKLGRESEDLNEGGHLEVNGQSAQYIFAGIRKLIQVESSPETAKGRLPSGTEATYSVMEVDTLEAVEALARGEAMSVYYRE